MLSAGGVRVVPFLSDLEVLADTYLATNDFLPSDYGDRCSCCDRKRGLDATNAVYYGNGEEESESCVIVMVNVDTYAGFVTIYVDFLEIFEKF